MRALRRLAAGLLLCLLLAQAAASAAPPPPTGRVSEYPLAAGTRAVNLAAGPDGNVWFAGVRQEAAGFADVVGKVTPDGQVTEIQLGTHPGNLGLGDIVLGADGNLWFSFGGRPEIGRITPAGAVSRFALPSGMSAASMAAGADGSVWFTIFGGHGVGRIAPDGAVREVPLLEDFSDPAGIAAGPDGALWVTEPAPGRITRIATDGAQRPFPLPDPGGYALQIAPGPDGALWFGKRNGSVLGRITTAGEVTEFPVPVGHQTYAVAAGPDGDVWYSNGGGQIGSITSTGAIAEPACIRSCRLPISDLVTGPEGKLWFAAGTAPGEPGDAPGAVGTFAPPPLTAGFPRPPELRGRSLRLAIACDGGAAGQRCQGKLRLLGRVPGSPRVLAERPLRLALGAERAISLRLPGPAARRLAERGRLAIRLRADVAGGRASARAVVLRRG